MPSTSHKKTKFFLLISFFAVLTFGTLFFVEAVDVPLPKIEKVTQIPFFKSFTAYIPLQFFTISAENNPSFQNKTVSADFLYEQNRIVARSSIVASFATNPTSKLGALKNPETYTTRQGETWDSIGQKLSRKPAVLALFNNLDPDGELAVGQTILVPPQDISKIYTVRRGDTLLKIARTYGVSIDILAFINRKPTNSVIQIGEQFLVPSGGEYQYRLAGYENLPEMSETISAKQDLDGFFISPLNGLNFGIPHSRNAVDVAAPCGLPVYAAASGIVLDARGGGAWNGGLGNFIKIQHYDGISTATYAHFSSLAKGVKNGIKVNQGDLIGLVGNTGEVIGKNGCHLHFEVLGRNNPLVKIDTD